MSRNTTPQFYLAIFFKALFVFLFCVNINGERLPFKTYTTTDGLASDDINIIKPDSHGFLWFCTSEGLSRFDGYNFKTYTQNDGLPHRNVNDILETRDGNYLVATTAGLAVFNPNGKSYRWNILEGKLEQNDIEPPLFKTYFPTNSQSNASKGIFSLAEDGNGHIFAGTNGGLYRISKSGTDWQFERVEFEDWKDRPFEFNFLFTDSRKDIWIATNLAIYLISKDGLISKINNSGGNSVFEDRAGRIWVDSGGNDIGIRVYAYQNGRSVPDLINTYSRKDGLPANGFTNAVAETGDGRIFVDSDGKLSEFIPGARENEPKFRQFDNPINNAATDKSGNIWFNLRGKGVGKYSPNSFTVYDERDGIPKFPITSIFSHQNDEVFFTVDDKDIMRLTGSRIDSVVPQGDKGRLWGDTFLDFQSSSGEWWITSAFGLRHYPKPANFKDLTKTPPDRIYTTQDGFFGNAVFNLFEDSRGDIWINATDYHHSLNRLEKSTGKIYHYTEADGVPQNSGAISYGEDAAGNIWIGFYFGQLARYKDGKFRLFTAADGIPEGYISNMLSDSQGHFWLATASRGLFMVDNPNAENPTFTNVSAINGLSSNQAFCLAEDRFGRIYAGTGRGINSLDPKTNQIKIYTEADGLPGNVISHCFADKNGVLWFASNNSLIRFQPQKEPPVSPPPIFIDGIHVNGVKQPISELGEMDIENLEFASDQRQIQIGFFALSFGKGERLRYQYKIDGIDTNKDWTTSTDQREITFNLASGNYIFEVRAVNSDGIPSDIPAKISFRILSPIWQRWWFITLAILIVGGAIFALDRYRVSKTKQVEKALNETNRANVLIRESENRFRTLADTASDAIFTVDGESRIIFVNEAIEKVFGYAPNELIGEKMTVLIPEKPDHLHNTDPDHYVSIKKGNSTGEGINLTGRHKSGHEIPLEVSFGEFEREGKRFFTGIARDISERKRAEQELQKAREEKFAELQRVRKRIATDLHDDIGSSLTQIAVLSEVARGQANNLHAENLTSPLERIKSVSKELVAVMSDIVWAINPNKDFLHDLVQRMRRFASDVFTGRGIKFEFHAPDVENDLQLGANIRREVFAIFKESVNNSVKYSNCTVAKTEFQVEDSWLILRIEDNGCGFDTNKILSENYKPELGGNGLVNMQRRALELGGDCRIESIIGKGTTITVRIPL